MLILQNISYTHPNQDLLFENINLTVNQHDKIGLIGNNGTGKSTLLKIIAGELTHSGGQLNLLSKPYYVPQIFGQFNHLTIAQALNIEGKLSAFKAILNGDATEENYELLNDDWMIEERCSDAFNYWQLSDLSLSQQVGSLSGGQKTKVFLTGISIHQPEFILLDEPTNHLDTAGRELLYKFILESKNTLIMVSHDRKLLNLLDTICELNPNEIKVYGGNYDFYKEQKRIEINALAQSVQSKEKAWRKAKEKERETLEKHQRLDSRAKKNLKNAGIPKIVSNTLRNSAERSSAKVKSVHSEKVDSISEEMKNLRLSLPDRDKMKFGFDNSTLHKEKILVKAQAINFSYHTKSLWTDELNFQILSGERIALKGTNGSGKTTLIKLILGTLEPSLGKIYRAENKSVYIDQDYSLIDNKLSVYEMAQSFNVSALHEHEIKTRLNRFLFTKEDWDKSCGMLSGGERMRLMLCCLTIDSQSPDIIIMDEPTNNLDIQNVEILTTAINEYQGTLIVVSHDDLFLEEVNIQRIIQL